jgi:hypothetical protein
MRIKFEDDTPIWDLVYYITLLLCGVYIPPADDPDTSTKGDGQ